ncbi:MAG: hypothetical protein IKZ88_08655 [Neisseriaceae bacterium]|nr:hypothetical protein [Neisseriaceae bacterium]
MIEHISGCLKWLSVVMVGKNAHPTINAYRCYWWVEDPPYSTRFAT